MPVDSIGQLLSWKPEKQISIIEDGILLPETRLIIFGQAKSWKSMLSLYTAFSIANGTPWFGYKTTKAVPIKYQVELPKAIDRERVAKFAKNVGEYSPDIFFRTPRERVKLDTSMGKMAIAKDIEEVQARCPSQHIVLILDPLYKLMAGHISDEYDVKKFQDNVDEIKDKYHISLVLIHHSRLTRVDAGGDVVDLGAEEAMGSSYWNNWCDTMIRLKVTNPFTGANEVGVSFSLTRNAQTILQDFEVRWDRSTLQPCIIRQAALELGEPTIRDLKEE